MKLPLLLGSMHGLNVRNRALAMPPGASLVGPYPTFDQAVKAILLCRVARRSACP